MARLLPPPVPHPFLPLVSPELLGPATCRVMACDGCEEISGALGEFGRSPDNPVPVAGPEGMLAYLDRLRLSGGASLLFHRIGGFTCRALGRQVLCLETVGIDGHGWDLIFFSLDHAWTTPKLPRGYALPPDTESLGAAAPASGTLSFCPDFPFDLVSIGSDGAEPSFQRPPEHVRRLATLMLPEGETLAS